MRLYVDKRRTMGYDGGKQEFPVEHVYLFLNIKW